MEAIIEWFFRKLDILFRSIIGDNPGKVTFSSFGHIVALHVLLQIGSKKLRMTAVMMVEPI